LCIGEEKIASTKARNGSRPNDDIEKVTGRAATSFQDFARRSAAAWPVKAAK
jgi:hypothetical protein